MNGKKRTTDAALCNVECETRSLIVKNEGRQAAVMSEMR